MSKATGVAGQLTRAYPLVALAALLGMAAIGAIHSPELPLRDPRDVGVLVTLVDPELLRILAIPLTARI